MYFNDVVDGLSAKIEEMDNSLKALLESDVSENTKRTQKFQRNRDIHTLRVLKYFVEMASDTYGQDTIEGMPEDIQKYLGSIMTLTSERKAKYLIEVHEGDKIMELMQKYENTKDIYHKMMKAAEEAGLKADFAKGIFIKA